MNEKKVIIYRSEREKLFDEWLMDGGYQVIGGLCAAFIGIVALCFLYDKLFNNGGSRRHR